MFEWDNCATMLRFCILTTILSEKIEKTDDQTSKLPLMSSNY